VFTLLIAFVHINNTRRCYNKRKDKYWEHVKIPQCNNKNITKNTQSKIVKVSILLFKFVYMNNTQRCYNRIKEKLCQHITFTHMWSQKKHQKHSFLYFSIKITYGGHTIEQKKNNANTVHSSHVINTNNTKSNQSRIVKLFTLLIAFVHIYTTRRCYSKRKEKYWEHIKIPRCNNKNITKNSQSKIVKVSSLLFRFVFMNNTRRCYNRIKEKIMRTHYIPPYVITKNPTKTLLFVFVHKNNIWRSYNRTKEK